MNKTVYEVSVLHSRKSKNNRVFPNINECTKLTLSSLYGEFMKPEEEFIQVPRHAGYSLRAIPNMEYNPYESGQPVFLIQAPRLFIGRRGHVNILSVDIHTLLSDYRRRTYPYIYGGCDESIYMCKW